MQKKSTLPPSIERYILFLVGIIVVDLGLIFFLQTQVKTIGLLKDQEIQLKQDQKIINSSEQIYNTYKDNISEILDVFPSETQVLTFLQTLETMTKKYSDTSAVKFASLSPQPEGDKLYLLFTIAMQTDVNRINEFLTELEKLPYMTRVLTTSISLPDGIHSKVNVSINLKLYVQNPFTIE